jgi:hypothetical protein
LLWSQSPLARPLPCAPCQPPTRVLEALEASRSRRFKCHCARFQPFFLCHTRHGSPAHRPARVTRSGLPIFGGPACAAPRRSLFPAPCAATSMDGRMPRPPTLSCAESCFSSHVLTNVVRKMPPKRKSPAQLARDALRHERRSAAHTERADALDGRPFERHRPVLPARASPHSAQSEPEPACLARPSSARGRSAISLGVLLAARARPPLPAGRARAVLRVSFFSFSSANKVCSVVPTGRVPKTASGRPGRAYVQCQCTKYVQCT